MTAHIEMKSSESKAPLRGEMVKAYRPECLEVEFFFAIFASLLSGILKYPCSIGMPDFHFQLENIGQLDNYGAVSSPGQVSAVLECSLVTLNVSDTFYFQSPF